MRACLYLVVIHRKWATLVGSCLHVSIDHTCLLKSFEFLDWIFLPRLSTIHFIYMENYISWYMKHLVYFNFFLSPFFFAPPTIPTDLYQFCQHSSLSWTLQSCHLSSKDGSPNLPVYLCMISLSRLVLFIYFFDVMATQLLHNSSQPIITSSLSI